MDVSFSELRELVMDRETWHAVIHGVAKSRTQLSDWTELIVIQLQGQEKKKKMFNRIYLLICANEFETLIKLIF